LKSGALSPICSVNAMIILLYSVSNGSAAQPRGVSSATTP
jgi:hypothetical protein